MISHLKYISLLWISQIFVTVEDVIAAIDTTQITSFFESELEYILEWKYFHLDPLLQAFGPFVPWVSNFLQTGRRGKRHVVPFLPCLQFPFM